MDHPQVSYRFSDVSRLLPGEPNSVLIMIKTKSDEILHDPNTGQRILIASTLLPLSRFVTLSLRSSSYPDHILSLLLNKREFVNCRWLCGYLAPVISQEANRLGFGRNGFTLTIHVTITYQTFLTMPVFKEAVLRIVLRGRIDIEELKTLKMETEPCSICLQSLSGSKRPTRMTCSHVFHDQCLAEWLYRKNTCPLCRTVLYHP